MSPSPAREDSHVCCGHERVRRTVPGHRRRATGGRRRATSRRGQALVEFAVVCLVASMLLAAILTFGQILYCDESLQQAADLAARELARTPLPADDTFSQALQDPGVRKRVYDERYLVLTIDAGSNPITFNGGHPIGDFPLVNQQLYPIMIYDQLVPQFVSGPPPVPVLRYPGAVFKDPNPDATLNPPASGYLVRIPVVQYTPSPGSSPGQQVGWLAVVEEIPSTLNPNPFQVSSSQRGVVALRFNYPYQSASMSGVQPPADPTLPPGPPDNPVVPIPVNGTVYSPPPADVGDAVVSALFEGFGPYGGQYSLGQQAAWAQAVRPYRKVICAEAIYRREVFQ